MATTLPAQVRPGDIISADLINAMLDELAELRGTASGGTQTVPDVFGSFLSDARTVLSQPALQLSLGFTFDVHGAAVDPLAPANQSLVVLNQSPVANALVAVNTPVNLVVSAAASTPAPAPAPSPPTVTRAEKPDGTTATAFAVGSTMVIVGTNFSATAAQNTVKFDTVTTPATPDPADPTRRLLVVVPTGIPNAPVNSGDAARPGVVVSVKRGDNATTATTTITVNAPVASQPTIANVAPATQFETLNITITGTNFTAGAKVFIRDQAATVVSVAATQIVATVPNFGDIQSGGAPVAASLRVALSNGAEATFTGFRVRGA